MALDFKRLFQRSTKPKDRRKHERMHPRPGTTILIIDDSRTVQYALRHTLEQGHYKVLTAADGESGMQMAIDTAPDLILLDIVMPGLNGYKVTRMLRKHMMTAHIPIVLISGTDQPTERFWGMKMGANDFMPKPIPRNHLFHTVEHQLNAGTA